MKLEPKRRRGSSIAPKGGEKKLPLHVAGARKIIKSSFYAYEIESVAMHRP